MVPGIVLGSVADPNPDPDLAFFGSAGSGSGKKLDLDPGKNRIRILNPQKTPVIIIFSFYNTV